ncbi:MAG: EF-Tu/IF-2/RF-3 family GTPase, partial [Nitrososphaerales archaeon]
MNGNLVGIFGSTASVKTSFLSSIAKKNETEGIIVYQRNEAGKTFSFLDDSTFPEKIQGYARIASISDYAYYVFPSDAKLAPPDGELAILLDSLDLKGAIEVINGPTVVSDSIKLSFKGMNLTSYEIEERGSKSSLIDLSRIQPRLNYPKDHTLIYIDRSFNVKGVGVVALGFVLTGKVSVHDKLRLLPVESDNYKLAEVKGIQISDEDFDSTERGIRVGLSLKGIDLKDISKTSWMDDGLLKVSNSVEFDFKPSRYYKQATIDRDLHLEANGELLVARIVQGKSSGMRMAKLAYPIPQWDGMSLCVI